MVCVFLADGFEEMEALCPVDLLRRGGVEVKTVSVHPSRRAVEGAHGIRVEADLTLEELKAKPDLAVLPGGGKGVENLKACAPLAALLKKYRNENVTLAAICAAPMLLSDLGLLEGRRMTCYPTCRGGAQDGAYENARVCIEPGLITSAGPGTACDFGLALLEHCAGKETAKKVAEGALLV